MAARDYAFEVEVDDTEPICTKQIITDGGRDTKNCGEVAERICGRCYEGRCEGHSDGLEYYILSEEDGGIVVCADCVYDEEKDGASLAE